MALKFSSPIKLNRQSTSGLNISSREGLLWFILLLVTTLGGAVRKWFTTSGAVSNAVLLVQMLLPFLMYALASTKAKNPFGRYAVFTLYFFYLFVQVFNPLQPTFFHGMLGFIVHGMFWMGMFFYFANRDLFTLDRFLLPIVTIVLGEVVLAFIQYGLPTNHFLNKYANEGMQSIAIVGDRVRVTGTFSYLSGYTAFLLFYPFFVWALIFKRAATWFVFTVALAGLVAAFMTGSRGGVGLYIVFIGFALFENYRFRDIAPLLGKLIIPVMITISIFLVVRGDKIGKQVEVAYNNYSERVKGLRKAGEESRRLTWDFRYFQGNRFKYAVFGIGTGSTYQGATILFGTSSYAIEFGYVESEFIKNILEGGFLLIFLKFLIAAAVVQKLCFGGVLFKIVLWGVIVYAAPIVFNVHNASFLMMGLIYLDSAAWQAKRQTLMWQSSTGIPPDETTIEKKNAKIGYPQIINQVSGYRP